MEARYPAILFKQQLTACVEKIFGLIRDNLKKEISPLLGLCIQVNDFLVFIVTDLSAISLFFIFVGYSSIFYLSVLSVVICSMILCSLDGCFNRKLGFSCDHVWISCPIPIISLNLNSQLVFMSNYMYGNCVVRN